MNQIKKIKLLPKKTIREKLIRVKKTFIHVPIIKGLNKYPYVMLSLTDFNPPMRPEMIEDMADLLIYSGNFEKADIIVSEADRGGGPLTHAVARKTNLPYTLANWYPVKNSDGLYFDSSVAFAGKGYIGLNGLKKGQKVILVDDIVSSGGTAIALINAINNYGAQVIEALFVGDKVNIGGSKKINDLFHIRVISIVKFVAEKIQTEEYI